MNVWIIVLTTMFSPVIEPLGIMPSAQESLAESQMEMATVPFVEPPVVQPDMRYRGIENLFEKFNTEEG